jgi:hypothetical protein
MGASPTIDSVFAATDLRTGPLTDVRGVDLRSPARDFWADEGALWDRLTTTWAGLDEAGWHLPGAARSDAGGPDWSLAEHVGHLADWQELAIDYIATAGSTGRWPSDDDYDGGDFDRFNERRRAPWTTMPATSIVGRLAVSRPRLLASTQRLPLETIRSDAAWGWIYSTLHGHYLDHLAVIEPWADQLLVRQVDGDPFVADPRTADHDGFLDAAREIDASFDALIRTLSPRHWGADVTPGWTLRDHVGHLADWMAEGARAIAVHASGGGWLADPAEGIDAWNERHVEARRSEASAETLARYDAARAEMGDAVASLSIEDLRSPDGWSWAYDCHYGHVRKHLAMVGRWCATQARGAD